MKSGRITGYVLVAALASMVCVGGQPAKAKGVVDIVTSVTTITGRVWMDTNQNGRQDVAELGMAAVEVSVDVWEEFETLTTFTTTTTAGGYYTVSLSYDGVRFVYPRFTAPDGLTFTSQFMGPWYADSDADIFTGEGGADELISGQMVQHLDAGLIPSDGVTRTQPVREPCPSYPSSPSVELVGGKVYVAGEPASYISKVEAWGPNGHQIGCAYRRSSGDGYSLTVHQTVYSGTEVISAIAIGQPFTFTVDGEPAVTNGDTLFRGHSQRGICLNGAPCLGVPNYTPTRFWFPSIAR